MLNIIKKHTKKHPSKIALIYCDKKITYQELYKKINAFAHYINHNFKPRTGIALHMGNCPEIVYCLIAILATNNIACPLNYRLTAAELTEILNINRAQCLIYTAEYQQKIKDINLSKTNIKNNVRVEEIPTSNKAFIETDIDEKKPAAIFFTSGSTGHPKGATHTLLTILNMSKTLANCLQVASDSIFLISEGISNISGFNHLLATLLMGATAVIAPDTETATLIDLIKRYHPSQLCMLISRFQELVNNHFITSEDFNNLKIAVTGGDVISVELQKRFFKLTQHHLQVSYGMTEAMLVTCNHSKGSNKRNSIGKAAPNMQIRLIDGEIQIKSPALMIGYWENPEENKRCFTTDDWFKTGDLADCDEDEYYWFRGRKKNIFVRKGANISPYEIERTIAVHNAVHQATVIPYPDKIQGHVPIAFIKLRPGYQLTSKALNDFLSTRLAQYKLPEIYYFVETFPMTNTGKINRKKTNR